MGKTKYLKEILGLFEKTPVVNIGSIKRIVGEDNSYTFLLLHNLIRTKKIYRLTKGWYSKSDDPTLLVYCFKPSYLGLQEALSIHNLWEQETNVIILTTKTIREGRRKIFNNVIIRRLPKNLFFGIQYKKYGETYIPVSDIEKTFLDLIYYNQPLDKQLISNFKKRINKKKLEGYIGKVNLRVKKEAAKLVRTAFI